MPRDFSRSAPVAPPPRRVPVVRGQGGMIMEDGRRSYVTTADGLTRVLTPSALHRPPLSRP